MLIVFITRYREGNSMKSNEIWDQVVCEGLVVALGDPSARLVYVE